ncbi:MAG: hypothetical protein KAQ85_00200 [Thermodesulfovibrionia bacterium]|nr:hypothetical protein [Thermodesulfovibrionia bacterium]
MISKVRELLGISRPKQEKNAEAPTITPTEQKPITTPQFGILSALAGTWPINRGDYMVPDAVPIPNNENVKFFETFDGRILIKYKSSKIYTTFDEINQLLAISRVDNELEHVSQDFSSNQRTCIRQFMIAVRNGLKPGDSVELDPDKDFRPILKRPSTIEHERGTLEQVSIDD